jgi:hypothetical protein
MTVLTHRGAGPSFRYAGQPMHVLAGEQGRPPASAAIVVSEPVVMSCVHAHGNALASPGR